MQTIPIETERGAEIRETFNPKDRPLYEIKAHENSTHWESHNCYQVRYQGELVVTINSKSYLFEDLFLDYYAEDCGLKREGLTIKYTGKSLVVNTLR